MLFVPNLFGIGIRYADCLWSVGAEEQFYLVWPWFVQKVKRERVPYFLVLIVVGFTFAPHIIDYLNSYFFKNNNILYFLSHKLPKTGFAAMATGALIAYFTKYEKEKLLIVFSRWFQYVLLIVLCTSWIMDIKVPFIEKEYFCILFALLIANAAVNKNVVFSLENKLFNFLGKISFGLYVFHLIGLDIAIFLLHDLDSAYIFHYIFIVGVLIKILFASYYYYYYYYYYFEQPFLRIKNSKKYTLIPSKV